MKKVLSNLKTSKRLNAGLCFLLWAVCSSSIILTSSLSHASELEKQTWSLRFNNVAVGDVLKQLSEATGVEISTNKTPSTKHITRSYEDQTIENIIRDAFRGTSYALVWNYGENHLQSIGICFFDSGGGGSPNLSAARSSRPNNRVVGRSLDRKPPRSARQRSQPINLVPRGIKSKSRTVAQDRSKDDEMDEDEDYEMDEDEEDEE